MLHNRVRESGHSQKVYFLRMDVWMYTSQKSRRNDGKQDNKALRSCLQKGTASPGVYRMDGSQMGCISEEAGRLVVLGVI